MTHSTATARLITLVAVTLSAATAAADATSALLETVPELATELRPASQSRPEQELNVNLFRNPSIGVEYRRGSLAVHVGMYPTIISRDADGEYETSWFAKAGVTAFFLGRSLYGQRESEVYVTASYLRGLDHGHGNAAMVDVGYRWMVWRGLNIRLGVAALIEHGHDVKINPTPGIGWSTTL